MAIKKYAGDRITALSTDTKPSNVLDGAVIFELDTKKVYIKTDGVWENIIFTKFFNVIVAGKRDTAFFPGGMADTQLTFPVSQVNVNGEIASNWLFGSHNFAVGDIIQVNGYITIDFGSGVTESSTHIKLIHRVGMTDEDALLIGIHQKADERLTVPFHLTKELDTAGYHGFYILYPSVSDNTVVFGTISIVKIFERDD